MGRDATAGTASIAAAPGVSDVPVLPQKPPPAAAANSGAASSGGMANSGRAASSGGSARGQPSAVESKMKISAKGGGVTKPKVPCSEMPRQLPAWTVGVRSDRSLFGLQV